MIIFKKLDFYRSISSEFSLYKQNLIGGILSILTVILILLYGLYEFNMYMTPQISKSIFISNKDN